MKGQEAVEIAYHGIVQNNRSFRFDSTFFEKKAVLLDGNIKRKSHFFLKNNEVVSGPFGSTLKSHSYLSEGVPFVRIQNIKGGFSIDKADIVYISEENNILLKNSQLFVDDLVLSKVGNSIGYYARIDEKLIRCNISENNLGIKLQAYSQPMRHYIMTYLNSKVGFDLAIRRISGNAQPKLNVFDITEIPIPKFLNDFYQEISNCVLFSKERLERSKQAYTQAEQLLLEEIGLLDFKPSQDPVNIKSFQESFGTSGRLDAEYYQKKYEQVVEKVKSKKYETLSNIVDIKKSIEPGSKNYVENGLPFMRVADLSKYGLSEPQKFISEHFTSENKDKIKDLTPKKGIILFSKDGSVGIAYHLRQDYKGITSGAILHLTIKDESQVIPEYLTLALNSKVVQMQAERDAGGSIILHWRSSEIANVVVPIIDYRKQQQIADLIEQSFALKKESEHLLEVAKRAVEIAIEENEDIALAYINQETKE